MHRSLWSVVIVIAVVACAPGPVEQEQLDQTQSSALMVETTTTSGVLYSETSPTISAAQAAITIDATALSVSKWSITGSSSEEGAASQVKTIGLLPGGYHFCQPLGQCFGFSVGAMGTLDYDARHDAYVSGRGTSSLTVRGLPITVDATALSATAWSMDGGWAGSGPSSQVKTLRLLPGGYGFHQPLGQFFLFKLLDTGTLDYDTRHDAYVSGRGTSSLTVRGLSITVDATALSATAWSMDGGWAGSGPSSQVKTLRLLPGGYGFHQPLGQFFLFKLLDTGTLDYDARHDAYVSGRGTSSLTVRGLPITVDATALSATAWSIDRSWSGSGPSSQVKTLRLLPGGYDFHQPVGQFFHFNLLDTGTLDYDARHDAYVSGRGTSSLTVRGLPITVDATALSAAAWSIDCGWAGSGPSSQVKTVRLLPGAYSFCWPQGQYFGFSVSELGTLDYAHALDMCVHGRGTNRLTIVCEPWSPPTAETLIQDLQTLIRALPASVFKGSNKNRATALIEKLNDVLALLAASDSATSPELRTQLLQEALDKLAHDIRPKTDGCGVGGAPDQNDWLVDCATQADISALVDRIMAAISARF